MSGRALERWGVCWRGFFTAEVVCVLLPGVLEPSVTAWRMGGCCAGVTLGGFRGWVFSSDVAGGGSGH